MPLRTIVVVTLRIYTIIFVVEGLVQFALTLPAYAALSSEASSAIKWSFLAPIVTIAIGVVLWCATLPLARMVTRGHDVSIDAVSLKKEDLYNFAFVFLGTYIVLSYVSPAVNNGYKFFAYDFNLPPESHEKGHFLVPFVADLVAIGFGFASALGASKWAKKLLKRDELADASRNLPS
jgi:hypothetical protein